MTTNLSGIITLENIALGLEAASKGQLFDQIGQLFEKQSGLPAATISANLLEREKLASTGLGHGVAVPHSRVKGLKSATAALVRLAEPLSFDSPDNKPVDLMIALLIPDNVTQKHLEILSEIAEMFSDAAFRQALMAENQPEAIYRMVVSWHPAHAKKT
ncbi:MAG: PTS sugar transporter subunit IIA [Burkholderiaceae bacterium]|jgi:PTS system nitrogen regulatory IIA component|nr:PTS sugar transporter subunit IIA [Burkholderiaceae bacterium]